MTNIMGVLLNGIAQLEYDRDKLLPEHQLAYLDRMDAKMDSGILIGNETVHNPDLNQRTQFAAANLVHALQTADEATAAAMCSYLAIRLPDLKQVRIEDDNDNVTVEFVFDESYRKQVVVDFKPLH
ncbi:MAG TPA: hypothetical protein VM011_03160 [Gammaproteobacteria bacterium]|nr:hypothetical protein [Gammaproteobacteria bacterium]